MNKSGLQCDKDAYRKVRDAYSTLINETRKTYYSNLIDECAGDATKLFRIVNPPEQKTSPQHEEPQHEEPLILANEFGDFFYKKIELVKSGIDNISVNPPDVYFHLPQVKLENFSSILEDEIRRIIFKSSNASCQLDPIHHVAC